MVQQWSTGFQMCLVLVSVYPNATFIKLCTMGIHSSTSCLWLHPYGEWLGSQIVWFILYSLIRQFSHYWPLPTVSPTNLTQMVNWMLLMDQNSQFGHASVAWTGIHRRTIKIIIIINTLLFWNNWILRVIICFVHIHLIVFSKYCLLNEEGFIACVQWPPFFTVSKNHRCTHIT